MVVDAFAGVGPFAIPAGKKGCAVLASDLNPASASALAEAARINYVRSPSSMLLFNDNDAVHLKGRGYSANIE